VGFPSEAFRDCFFLDSASLGKIGEMYLKKQNRWDYLRTIWEEYRQMEEIGWVLVITAASTPGSFGKKSTGDIGNPGLGYHILDIVTFSVGVIHLGASFIAKEPPS